MRFCSLLRTSTLLLGTVFCFADPSICQNFESPGKRHPPDDPGWNLGHTRRISYIEFSPDGSSIATASDDFTVRLWDTGTGTLRRTFTGHTDDVSSARFSPDGTMLASGSQDKSVRIWFVDNRKPPIVMRGHREILWSLCWSPDGKTLASGAGDGQIIVWDTKGSKKLQFRTPYTAIDVLAFSPSGRTIMINGRCPQPEPSPLFFDAHSGRRISTPLSKVSANNDQFSPDGSLIALPGEGHVVSIRDGESGKVKYVIKSLTTETPKIIFSRNSKYFLALSMRPQYSDELAQLYEVSSGKPECKPFEAGYISESALSPNGRLFAMTEIEHENRFLLRESTSRKTLWASADPALILGSKASKELLNQLCADYKAYGLPYPLSSTVLAYIQPRRKVRAPGEPQRTLALVDMPTERSRRPKYYVAFGQREIYEEEEIIPVTPEQASLSGTKPGWNSFFLGPSIWGFNSDMLAAIHMQQRGWADLAMKFLGRALADYRMDARKDLAKQAWAYWWSTIKKPDSDRIITAQRMTALMKTHYVPATEENRSFVQDLELSLKPSKAAAGSIDGDIDDLVNMTDESRTGNREKYPAFKRLWLRGFEAVPALLGHLDDRRYSRVLIESMGNASPYYARVREIVADLIKSLAGDDAAVGVEWYSDGPGYRCKRAKAESWWAKAKAIGEESYLVEHVLPKENKEST